MMTHDPAAHVTIWWGIVWYNYTAGLASGGGEGEGGEGGGGIRNYTFVRLRQKI